MAISHHKTIESFHEAYSKKDNEKIKGLMSEEVWWSFLGQHKLAGIKNGIQEVIRFFDNLNSIMSNSNTTTEKIISSSNQNHLIECQHVKTNRTDDINIDLNVTVLWTFEFGEIISGQHFFSDPKAADIFFNAVPMKTIHLFGNIPVIVLQTFKAPIEKVWAALTEANQMKKWYLEAMNSFEPVVGFQTEFDVVVNGNKHYLHKWKITEVVINKKISYSWQFGGYGGEWHVTFELISERNQTKLKLTNSGIESFPLNNKDFSRESCLEGWEFFIGKRLKEYLEG